MVEHYAIYSFFFWAKGKECFDPIVKEFSHWVTPPFVFDAPGSNLIEAELKESLVKYEAKLKLNRN